jgi:MFS transporter, FSR family, fosmidomycin resistance protein
VSASVPIDRGAMVRLSTGHLAADFVQASVPALIPFFVGRFDLSYTLAAVLMLASTVSSAAAMPLLGLWSDRRGAMWLIPGGLAVAGVGIGLATCAPDYWLVVVLIFAAGLGVGAFHPEGTKFAAYASGSRLASGMAYFNFGGNIGYAAAPVVITPLVLWLGLKAASIAAVPVIAIAIALRKTSGYLSRLRRGQRGAGRAGRDRVGAISLLLAVVMLRHVAWFGLLTFAPLYALSVGHSKTYASNLLVVTLVAGAAGALCLGRIADRFGLRATLLLTLVTLPPLIVGFVTLEGHAGEVALAAIGFLVAGTFGVTMVLAQLYLPNSVALAAGLVTGFPTAFGGIATVVLGAVADAVDLRTALYIGAAAPAVGAILCLLLPRPTPVQRSGLVLEAPPG